MNSFNDSITAELEAETQAIEAIKVGIREKMNGTDFSFFDILDTLQEEGFYHYESGHTEIISAALVDMIEDKEIIKTGDTAEERGFELYRLNVPMVDYYQIGQTFQWVFVALTPIEINATPNYSIVRTVNNRKYGNIATKSIPDCLDEMPALTEKRVQACEAYRNAQYEKAYLQIETAFPSLIQQFNYTKRDGCITVYCYKDPVQVLKQQEKDRVTSSMLSYKGRHNYYRGSLNAAMRWLCVRDMCALLSIEGLKASDITNYYADERIALPQLPKLEMLALLAWAVEVGFLCEDDGFYTLNVQPAGRETLESIAA